MLRCDSQAEKTPPPCDTRLTISLLNQARSWLNGQGQGVLLVKHLKDVWLVRGVPSGTSMIATPPDSPKASDPHSGLISPCLREVFSQTGADSRVLKTDGEDMQNRDHPCFFSSTHAAKDSGIALTLAHEKGLNLPLAEASKKQYDRMVSEGFGDLDKSGVAELTFPGRGKK